MSNIRPAAVAGSFYPDDPRVLAREVAALLSGADPAGRGHRFTPTSWGPPPKAIIAPHAGYMYSGSIAASVYSRLLPLRDVVRRVVLAGPAHRVFVRGAAVPGTQAFETPLGPIPIDRDAIASLLELPFVETSSRAHAAEHSLEVHLPFLQTVLGRFSLVPVVVGDASPGEMAQLFERIWGAEETLVVVSSDLSHFHAYEAARDLDRTTCDEILRLNPVLIPEQACGAAPINGLLEFARRHGLTPELVDLLNSGDTAGGRDRVVGYGAFAFHEPGRA